MSQETVNKTPKADEPRVQDVPKELEAADLLKGELAGFKDLKIKRAKGSKRVPVGICHIKASFNNIHVCFTDLQGNVIAGSSAGKCNFRGSKKSTAYAAQVVTSDAARKAMSYGLEQVSIELNGPGMGRDPSVRALQSIGLSVTSISDVTPIPHNGCRPPKQRRV